jgi:hypothetical protein
LLTGLGVNDPPLAVEPFEAVGEQLSSDLPRDLLEG